MAPEVETPAAEAADAVATETPVDAEAVVTEPEAEKITEPTFDDDKVDITNDQLNAMDAYVSALEESIVESETVVASKDAEIASLKAKISEMLDGTGSAMSELEARDKRIAELETNVNDIEELWKLVSSHPQIGKLNSALIKGEQIDLSQAVIDFLESEM